MKKERKKKRKEREFSAAIQARERAIFAGMMRDENLVHSAYARGVAEVVAQTGEISWFVAPTEDGKWVAWNTSRFWPRVLVRDSREEALATHTPVMEFLAASAQDKEEAAVLRDLAAKFRAP